MTGAVSFEDRDNFIRNAVTILGEGRRPESQVTLSRISTGGLPVPIEEILEDLKVDDPEEEQETVERMARGACAFIERRTGYSLLPTVFELTTSAWWNGALEILRGPFRDLDEIAYLSERDTWTPVDSLSYWTTSGDRSFKIRFLSEFTRPPLWQPEDCVRLRFQTGFDAADESGGDRPIDDGLRTVLLMVTGHYYQNRELLGLADPKYGLQAVELGATSLLGQYRQFW